MSRLSWGIGVEFGEREDSLKPHRPNLREEANVSRPFPSFRDILFNGAAGDVTAFGNFSKGSFLFQVES
jgi:hypothetical protein